MRNTSPEPPIAERATPKLLEDLCLALRDVGVRDHSLPDNDHALAAVRNVQTIHEELEKRGVDLTARLSLLSEETQWQMEPLLRECLSFPDAVPYVRESDGIRRAFRCYVCERREFPDRRGLCLCDDCLARAAESIRTRVPFGRLLLFRIFNESVWCEHADAETLMMAFGGYDGLESAWCGTCLEEERERRSGVPAV